MQLSTEHTEILSHQLVQFIPRLDLVVGDVQSGQIAAHRQSVEGVNLVVRHPQLFQCSGHIFELLNLNKNNRKVWIVSIGNTTSRNAIQITFLMRFLPNERIFSLLMPASEPMRSILLVESARRLKVQKGKSDVGEILIAGKPWLTVMVCFLTRSSLNLTTIHPSSQWVASGNTIWCIQTHLPRRCWPLPV